MNTNKPFQKSVYPARLQPWMHSAGWLGVGLVVLAGLLLSWRFLSGCAWLDVCVAVPNIHWIARICISGLLLGFLGFLER